ncbi:hypothetical protein PFICI_09954 [Pestalotiopsis fici W106-1]|uniref:Uncharacterized protein n=1 Tax=Pestalotiopsis fici (strain W106-1 / CGMCC3.15140) TaxID=1229662 RepID=W3WXN5_PESFW|nr:uncharacterized protein PFICI_09954 [Pestalotiopsis fici W106-1]ETS77892.1 hypothetical protein PFICI_09954 [Pestalotiopsis fici W106-1]
MSSNGDPPIRDEQDPSPNMDDESGSLENQDVPAASPPDGEDDGIAPDSSSGVVNGPELPPATDAAAQSPGPRDQASDGDALGPDDSPKDNAEDSADEEDDDSNYELPLSQCGFISGKYEEEEEELSDTDTCILNPDDDFDVHIYSKPRLAEKFRLASNKRVATLNALIVNQANVHQDQIQLRDDAHSAAMEVKRRQLRKKKTQVRQLRDQIQRLRGNRVQETPWIELMRAYLQGRREWEEVFRACCRQSNMSLDPKNVHPNLHWADVPEAHDAIDINNLLFPDEDGYQVHMEIDESEDIETTAEVNDAEIEGFPFNRLPVEVQQHIMEDLFVKPGIIHCLSRLDKRQPPVAGQFPYPCSGTSNLPHRFTYGNVPWSINNSLRPDHVLQPLLVCKRWLYLGIHAFYGLNTFAFSSLGEFGRFFKGIGNQRTQRVAHVELHWQGSVMAAHKTRINQRTLPLNYLPRMSRLQTVTIFIEEFKERRVRRAYEFPKKPKQPSNGNQEEVDDDDDEGFRAPGDEYDTSSRLHDFRRDRINNLAPPSSLLKRTAIQANWRGNRSLRTTHGMDYVYALRGLQWVRVYEHDISRQLIRDLTFLDDVNKVVTLPKDPRHQLETDLHSLANPRGLETYIPGFEDKAMVARFYETDLLPSGHDSSDGGSDSSPSDVTSSPSDDASSMNMDDPIHLQSDAESQGHNALDLIDDMIFPDDVGYQNKSSLGSGTNSSRGSENVPLPPVGLDNDSDDLFILRGFIFPDEPGYRPGPGAGPSDDGDSDDGDSDDSGSDDASIFSDSVPLGSSLTTAPSDFASRDSQMQVDQTEKDSDDSADNDDSLFVPADLDETVKVEAQEVIDLTIDSDEEDGELVSDTQSATSSRTKTTAYAPSMFRMPSVKQELNNGRDKQNAIDLTGSDDEEDDEAGSNSTRNPANIITKLATPPKNIIYDQDHRGNPRSEPVIRQNNEGPSNEKPTNNEERSNSEKSLNNKETPSNEETPRSGDASGNEKSSSSKETPNEETQSNEKPPNNKEVPSNEAPSTEAPSTDKPSNSEETPSNDKPSNSKINETISGPTSSTQSQSPKHGIEEDGNDDEGHNEKKRRVGSPTRRLQQRRKGRATGFIMSPSP